MTEILIRGKGTDDQYAGKGSAWIQDMGVYARRVEIIEAAPITTIYKAWAEWGSADNAAVWRIQRIYIDESANFIMTDGQAGTGSFTDVWDDRASLSYS